MKHIFFGNSCDTLHKKIKFSITDFFNKCDQILRKLRIWSYLLKKSLMENIFLCNEFFPIYCDKCIKFEEMEYQIHYLLSLKFVHFCLFYINYPFYFQHLDLTQDITLPKSSIDWKLWILIQGCISKFFPIHKDFKK